MDALARWLDAEDRAVLAVGALAVLGGALALLALAGVVGLAIRVFLLASGLG